GCKVRRAEAPARIPPSSFRRGLSNLSPEKNQGVDKLWKKGFLRIRRRSSPAEGKASAARWRNSSPGKGPTSTSRNRMRKRGPSAKGRSGRRGARPPLFPRTWRGRKKSGG